MKLIFGNKRRGKLFIKLILLSFLVYATALIISQRAFISNKQKKLEELKNQLYIQEVKVGDIRAELEAIKGSDPKYLEDIAHKDLNFSKQGERVFINAKGN